MASPQNRRTERREELDIDALFASEPDEAPEPRRPDSPTLIFTQPADRNVQQFADEPVQFAEEADPLAVPLLPGPEHPYHGRWKEPAESNRGRSAMLLGLVALLGVIAVVATLLVPRDRADAGAEVTTASAKPVESPPAVAPAPLPPPTETRETTTPAVEQPSSANVATPATPAPSRPESQQEAARPTPPSQVRQAPRTAPRETPRAAATTGRAERAAPPISTRGVTSAPSARTAPAPAASSVTASSVTTPSAPPPVLDTRRLGTEGPTTLGQPLGPPRELPAAPVLRDSPPAPPAPRVEPAPPAAAPSTPAPAPAVDPRAVETDRVRAVLTGYERAYSDLDADAASRVFPRVDRKALSRAFSTLSTQQIQFDDCRIQVQQASARATCAGTASWTPKVGGGTQQQARRWQFDLEQASGGWRIGSVRVQ